MNEYIDNEHINDFCLLLKKIPHPINFPFMNILFDNVNWFDDDNGCNNDNAKCIKDLNFELKYHKHNSNSILLCKEFDFGKKFNLITIKIERQIKDDILLPTPTKFNEFCNRLGKSNSETIFVFNEEEKSKFLKSEMAFKKLIDVNAFNNLFTDFVKEYPRTCEGIFNEVVDSISKPQNFSIKNIITKSIKATDFKYINCKNSCYKLKKTNKNNHVINIEFIKPPFYSKLFAEISIKGYNFNYILASTPEILIEDETQVESYVNTVLNIAKTLEDKYSEILLEYFGKTPDWYKNLNN